MYQLESIIDTNSCT